MKKIVMGALVVLSVLCFAGCKEEKKPNVPTKQLIDSIGDQIAKDQGVDSKEGLQWNEIDLMEQDGESILTTMKIDGNTLEEGIYYENPSSDKADRIVIVKVKEKKDVKPVKLAFDEMKKTQESDVGQVLKEEEGKVKSGIVYVRDNYVIYLVYDEVKDLKKIIDDALVK